MSLFSCVDASRKGDLYRLRVCLSRPYLRALAGKEKEPRNQPFAPRMNEIKSMFFSPLLSQFHLPIALITNSQEEKECEKCCLGGEVRMNGT